MAPAEGPWPRYPRNVDGAWSAIDDIRWHIDQMQADDESAQKIADALRRHWAERLSFWVKLGAIAIAFATIGDFILSLYTISSQ